MSQWTVYDPDTDQVNTATKTEHFQAIFDDWVVQARHYAVEKVLEIKWNRDQYGGRGPLDVIKDHVDAEEQEDDCVIVKFFMHYQNIPRGKVSRVAKSFAMYLCDWIEVATRLSDDEVARLVSGEEKKAPDTRRLDTAVALHGA